MAVPQPTNSEEAKKYDKINKNYQVIYTIIFKFGFLFLVIVGTVFLFITQIKKSIILDFDNSHEEEETQYIGEFQEDNKTIQKTSSSNVKILIKHGILEISKTILHSYNNLIVYKGFTMPRATYLRNNYNTDSDIKDYEYFQDPKYDIEELNQFLKKIVYIDYVNTQTNDKKINLIPLNNNSINDTFFITCINNFKIFNKVCDVYISQFLNTFFVYDITSDFTGLTDSLKTFIGKKTYKNEVCDGTINYIKYSNTAPSELEDIAILCGGDYLKEYYFNKDFIQVNSELENKYIKSNISKYKEINDYKLLSYQQILYNNMENNIPPYEGTFKDYTNYLATLLQKVEQNPLSSFYFDTTFRFNNFYLIPNLNKLKYQSTQTKREEIESIVASLEKINNGSSIDGYQGLRNLVSNDAILQKEINSMETTTTSGTQRENTMIALLKGIKTLNNIKIINDEIEGNTMKINGYLLINIKGADNSVLFSSELENKRGSLIIKTFSLNDYPELNETIKTIITQKSYNLPQMYEFIQENIGIYISDTVEITPCDLLRNKLSTLAGSYELIYCDSDKVNIVKGNSGDKLLYQIKMNNYNLVGITVTNREVQNYVNDVYSGIKTNGVSISNVIGNIVSYSPTDDTPTITNLQGDDLAISALDDLRNYLGITVTDIAEQDGKIAAEFTLNSINFIGIYDPSTKILGPIFLQLGNNSNNLNFRNFSLKLSSENQNEINRFVIETIQYLKGVDENLINIYINGSNGNKQNK